MTLRAICTVLLDPRDPLLHSERTQGFAADPDYWKGEVFAYVGLPQNLKDLKQALARNQQQAQQATIQQQQQAQQQVLTPISI